MEATLKPYPKYKQTGLHWLRDVPEHWDLVRTKHLFSERVQKGYPDEPLLAATQSKGVVRKDKYGNRTVTATKDLHLLKLVEPGDYVISLRSFEGGIELAHDRGIISPAYTVLRPGPRALEGYFAHFFKSKTFIDSLTLYVTGIREGQNVEYKRLSRNELPVPPPSEQVAIGRFLRGKLTRASRLIRAKKRLISLLNEQKQAIIQRAVTRGIDPDVPMKPSGVDWLGDVPAHWKIFPLKYLSSKIQNGATPPTSNQSYYRNGEVPWFGPSSISTDIDLGEPVRCVSQMAFKDGVARMVKAPALLVVVIGTVGKSALLLSDGSTNQQITAVELEAHKVDPKFIAWQVRLAESWLKSSASSATIPILDSGILARLPVAVPIKNEQRAISEHLDRELMVPNQAISRAEQEIELIREYRTRLLADVVTGKLDVRGVTVLEDEDEKSDFDLDGLDDGEFGLDEEVLNYADD